MVMHRLALVVALLLCAWASEAQAGVKVGDRASDFVKIVDAKGRRASLKRWKTGVVVLTFGASWCAPCKRELPTYEKLSKKYKKERVVFLAVNIDSESAKGKKFMRQAGLTCVRALYDKDSSTVDSYDPPKMPSTYVISKGIVKYIHGGFTSGDEDELETVIDREIGKL